MFAAAVALFCVVAIASYYLFGGPLKISLFFPAPTYYFPNYHRIPDLKTPVPGPNLGPPPSPLPSPKKAVHPSMRTSSKTDAIVHMSPAPYMPVPIPLVTPLPGPTYAPVTPPPFTPSKPVVTLPLTAGSPIPSPTP